MKSYLAISLLVALSGAQEDTSKRSPPASDPAAVEATCIKVCKSSDNVCRAECAKVPSPTEASIGLHNECIRECNELPSGPEAAACQVTCTKDNFMNYTRPEPVEEEPTNNSTETKNSTSTNSTSKGGSKNSTKSGSTSASSDALLAYKFPAYALAGLASFYLA
ncbi:hypothetical protein DSO57_1023939 [Entomophthora muscae]|uniref:Uncharacterized protein n=1 Tax=Entomophthora muscae TaxID=34485 RepID=A0ACC2UCJ2_9FUNG|nr:hypothetical protein DSO57_1023939 [Entomophthora muscae]